MLKSANVRVSFKAQHRCMQEAGDGLQEGSWH